MTISGAAGLVGTSHLTNQDKELVESVLKPTCPICEWVRNDADLDAVTALSGSGPAYYFLFTQLLSDTAEKLGLSHKVAQALAIQTAVGASIVSRKQVEEGISLTTLKEQVTSKGGTTEAALNVFEFDDRLRNLVENAVTAAYKRSYQLARDYGE